MPGIRVRQQRPRIFREVHVRYLFNGKQEHVNDILKVTAVPSAINRNKMQLDHPYVFILIMSRYGTFVRFLKLAVFAFCVIMALNVVVCITVNIL